MKARKNQFKASPITLESGEINNIKDFYLNKSQQFQELALGSATMANDFTAFQVFAPLTKKPLKDEDIGYLYKMLRYLIGHDAEPNEGLISAVLEFAPELKTHHAPNDGATLLHVAAFHNKKVANLLIRNGFIMQDKTTSGDTVAHFANLQQQVKGSTLQTTTAPDAALLNLAKLRNTLFLGLYSQDASDQKRVEYFQHTIKSAGIFFDSVEQYCPESIAEVLMCLINIHSISNDLNPLDYFLGIVGKSTLYTMHQIAISTQKYESLYEVCRTYGLLGYKCLGKDDRIKAIEYTSKMFNVPSDMSTQWKKDFAAIISNTSGRWMSLDREFAEKLLNTAASLDPNSDEIKMRHLLFYYNKADINGMKKIAHTFDITSDTGKVAVAECVFVQSGTSSKVFEYVFDKVLINIAVDHPSFDIGARSIFYSRLLEYHAIKKDEQQFALTSQEILRNEASTIDFGLIITSALSAMIDHNFTAQYLQFFSQFFQLHQEHQQSIIPGIRFAEFYCKLHNDDNLSAAKQALSELKQWSIYAHAKEIYTHASDLYYAYQVDNAIGESDLDAAATYASKVQDISVQNKYLSIIKMCRAHERHMPQAEVDTASPVVVGSPEGHVTDEVTSQEKETIQFTDLKPSTVTADAMVEPQPVQPTLEAQPQLLKSIFEALRFTPEDSEEYEQLIMLLSPSEVHQYYTEFKAQVLRKAIHSCETRPKIATWYHKSILYQSDNPDVVHIEGTEKCYATIKCTIDKSLYGQFKTVLDHIVSKKHGSNGIKYVSDSKCIELKIKGDNRLWTTEELVNPEEYVLLVFDHHGNHVAVSNLPDHALHTVYTDVSVIGDIL